MEETIEGRLNRLECQHNELHEVLLTASEALMLSRELARNLLERIEILELEVAHLNASKNTQLPS